MKPLPTYIRLHCERIREHWSEREAIDAEHAENSVDLIRYAIARFGSMQQVVYAAQVSQPQLSRALHGRIPLSWEATIRIVEALEAK